MFAHAADFNLVRNGVFCTVAVPPRDQLGRFLGNLPGYDDDEDYDDCPVSFDLMAETITDDIDEEIPDEDEVDFFEIDESTDWYLSPDEEAEMDMLNLRHNTHYWRLEDLTTLRRLDGLWWVKKTYGNYSTEVREKMIPSHSGSSGFGSGEKCTINQWACNRIHGRRRYDDGRKKRKAMFNRQLRANRDVRVINIPA